MRTTLHAALTASTVLGLVACTDVHCLDNERKVGAVCYSVRTTQLVDAAATATEDAGRTDSGSAFSKLDGATVIDGATSEAPAAPPPHGPIGEGGEGGPQLDAAASTPPGRDAAGAPAKATDAATAGATDAGTSASDAAATVAPDAAPPKCGAHSVNPCGGCEALAHPPGEPCSNGGTGVCDRPGVYHCLGEVTVCSAPPPMPGVEVCDGIDNDCDGTTDEDAMDARSWYEDCDADGFGKLENSVKACTAPPPPATCKAYVTTQPSFPVTLDCHDDAVTFHPGREYGGAVLDDGTPVTGPLLLDADCNGKVELSSWVSDPGPGPAYKPYCPLAGDPCTTPDTLPCARLDLPSLASVDACMRGLSAGATVYETIDRQCIATRRLVSVLCK